MCEQAVEVHEQVGQVVAGVGQGTGQLRSVEESALELLFPIRERVVQLHYQLAQGAGRPFPAWFDRIEQLLELAEDVVQLGGDLRVLERQDRAIFERRPSVVDGLELHVAVGDDGYGHDLRERIRRDPVVVVDLHIDAHPGALRINPPDLPHGDAEDRHVGVGEQPDRLLEVGGDFVGVVAPERGVVAETREADDDQGGHRKR
jgi:hypothetical protein